MNETISQDEKKALRLIVAASSAGTAFEWYDFFIFGTLTAIIAKNFFAGMNETLAYIVTLATFAVGFIFRPLGALVFGHIGDRKGRKGTFLYTILIMGLATIAIGLLPTYAMAGSLAPLMLIGLRMLQGFALGGEYGGAAIYVAEHAPDHKRGAYTGWIQTSAAFGLIAALGVIMITRTIVKEEAFADWGWRIPFILSSGLLVVSVYIRSKTHESPTFKAMEAAGKITKSPFKDAFAKAGNVKRILVALFGFMCAQGVIWYTAFFYTQIFMEKAVKLPPLTINFLIIAMTAVSAPLYIFFASLSDKLGRKPVMLFGIALASATFFGGFDLILKYGNPDLVAAQTRAPVVVMVDPGTCNLQFDPTGTQVFSSSCDLAKSIATGSGVSYRVQNAADGQSAILIGQSRLEIASGEHLDKAALKAYRAEKSDGVKAALKDAGYPEKADPTKVNHAGIFAVLVVFAIACTALYGPMASLLVEMFPTSVRYTGLSLPYNIGTGWFGGLQPAISFAMVAASGNVFHGLWYPVIVGAVSVVIYAIFVTETHGRDLESIEH